jgi:hypothetical protein
MAALEQASVKGNVTDVCLLPGRREENLRQLPRDQSQTKEEPKIDALNAPKNNGLQKEPAPNRPSVLGFKRSEG